MYCPVPRQVLLRESQRVGRPTNFRLAHRLTLPLPPPDRRLSTQPGHGRPGAGAAGRLWPYPPPPMCGPSGSQRPPGSPALDGAGGAAKRPRGRWAAGEAAAGWSPEGLGWAGGGKPQSRADLFTSKRPRAFQTSRHRPRGGSNCLPAGPTDHRAPLVGGGGGREEGLGRAAPRRSQTVSFPAPKCSPENAGLRFIDSGDPGRPSALDRDSWERAAGPRGRLIHSIY